LREANAEASRIDNKEEAPEKGVFGSVVDPFSGCGGYSVDVDALG
jgi:hypothetical protein